MKLTGTYTQQGAKLAAQAQAAESGLTITRAAAGSGLTAVTQTAMEQEEQALALYGKSAEGGTCKISAVLVSGQAANDYILREVGLFARLGSGQETLYKLFRLDEPIHVEKASDLTATFYLSETILQAGQLEVVISQQGLVTQQICMQIAQGAANTVNQAVTDHLGDSLAHSELLAQKAAAVHTHGASKITAGTLSGQVMAYDNTNYTRGQLRNIVLSSGEPSGGGNGQIWIQYEE